ncbi:MAG: hypothetical protein Q8R96_14335 [Bacteroidota bacterium]|nr:hypothetical protein [Bacteroidota bacterium]
MAIHIQSLRDFTPKRAVKLPIEQNEECNAVYRTSPTGLKVNNHVVKPMESKTQRVPNPEWG